MKRNLFVEATLVGVLFVAVFAWVSATDSSPAATEPEAREIDLDRGDDVIVDRNLVGTSFFDPVAEALGVDPATVVRAWRSGTPLTELIEETGADRSAVQDAISESLNTTIDEALERGRITEAEADSLRDFVAANLDAYLDLPLGVLDGGFGLFGLGGAFGPGDRDPAFEFFVPFDAPFSGERFPSGIPNELRRQLEELRQRLQRGELFPFDGELPEELRELLEREELFPGDGELPELPEDLRQQLEELRERLGRGDLFPHDRELPQLSEGLLDLLESGQLFPLDGELPELPEDLRQQLEELRERLSQFNEGELFPLDGELPELPEGLRDLLEGHELREFFRYLDPSFFNFEAPGTA